MSDCDCKRDKHEPRPAHPATMIGRRNQWYVYESGTDDDLNLA